MRFSVTTEASQHRLRTRALICCVWRFVFPIFASLAMIVASPLSVVNGSELSFEELAIEDNAIDLSLIEQFDSIVGGTATLPGDLRYTAALFRRINPARSTFWCGAVVISPRHVITAGHCAVNSINERPWPASSLFVVVGTNDRTDPAAERVDIVTSTIHPDFELEGFQNDIALLELDTAVTVPPIVIPARIGGVDRFPGTGDVAIAAGWGQTSESGSDSDLLRQVELPVTSHLRCFPAFQQSLAIEHRMCAGGLRDGGLDACAGDSGGPLVVHRNGIPVLAGLTSSGAGCARPGLPAIFTRVSAFSAWLETNTAGAVNVQRFQPVTGLDERAAALLLDDGDSITETLYTGQIQVYEFSDSPMIMINSLSGDSDLFVYDTEGLETGQPLCISQRTVPEDFCEIEVDGSVFTAVVYGFSDSSFTIEARGALPTVSPLMVAPEPQEPEQPMNDDPASEPPASPTPTAPDPVTPSPVEPTPAADPAPEPIADPAPEPIADPAPEPIADPAPEPIADPEPEPITEPLTAVDPEPEPVAEPQPEEPDNPAPEVSMPDIMDVVMEPETPEPVTIVLPLPQEDTAAPIVDEPLIANDESDNTPPDVTEPDVTIAETPEPTNDDPVTEVLSEGPITDSGGGGGSLWLMILILGCLTTLRGTATSLFLIYRYQN